MNLPCSLFDLNPRWVDWVDGRNRVGLYFDCPHCGQEMKVFFRNPLDGGEMVAKTPLVPHWEVRGGSGLNDLTLFPSVEWAGHCHIHIAGGNVFPA